MRRLDASSVDENLQKWGDPNRVSSTPGVAARLGRQAEHDVERPTGNLRDLRRPVYGSAFGSRAEGQQFLLGRVEPGRQQRGPAFEPAGACQPLGAADRAAPGQEPSPGWPGRVGPALAPMSAGEQLADTWPVQMRNHYRRSFPTTPGRLVRFFADTARAPGDLVDGANRWRNPDEDLVYRCRVGE